LIFKRIYIQGLFKPHNNIFETLKSSQKKFVKGKRGEYLEERLKKREGMKGCQKVTCQKQNKENLELTSLLKNLKQAREL